MTERELDEYLLRLSQGQQDTVRILTRLAALIDGLLFEVKAIHGEIEKLKQDRTV